jgi:hypothetical protein
LATVVGLCWSTNILVFGLSQLYSCLGSLPPAVFCQGFCTNILLPGLLANILPLGLLHRQIPWAPKQQQSSIRAFAPTFLSQSFSTDVLRLGLLHRHSSARAFPPMSLYKGLCTDIPLPRLFHRRPYIGAFAPTLCCPAGH